MNAARDQKLHSIIYEPVPGNTRQTVEALGRDSHREVPAFAGAGVAGVQVAVVEDFEFQRRQCAKHRVFDFSCGHAHGD